MNFKGIILKGMALVQNLLYWSIKVHSTVQVWPFQFYHLENGKLYPPQVIILIQRMVPTLSHV